MDQPNIETNSNSSSFVDGDMSADEFFGDVETAETATVPEQTADDLSTTPDDGSMASPDELPEGANEKMVAAYRKLQSERDKLKREYDELIQEAEPAMALWKTASVDPRVHKALSDLYAGEGGASAPPEDFDGDDFDFLPESVQKAFKKIEEMEQTLDSFRQQQAAAQFQHWKAMSEQQIDAMAKDKLLPFGVELKPDQRDAMLAMSLQNGVPLEQAFWAVAGSSVAQKVASMAQKAPPKERDADVRRLHESSNMLDILDEVAARGA